MKFAAIIAALAITATAQTTVNPLVSILSQASVQIKSYESAYSTTDAEYESLLSVAASQVSVATASLATNPSSAAIYSSLVSEYSSLLSEAVASATDGASGIPSAISSLQSSVSGQIKSAVSSGVTSRGEAGSFRVEGVLGAIGAGVLGLAAYL